jgi:hypothetical protein
VVRVRLVVEGFDFAIARAPIERDRFAERAIGFQAHRSGTSGACALLEVHE